MTEERRENIKIGDVKIVPPEYVCSKCGTAQEGIYGLRLNLKSFRETMTEEQNKFLPEDEYSICPPCFLLAILGNQNNTEDVSISETNKENNNAKKHTR